MEEKSKVFIKMKSTNFLKLKNLNFSFWKFFRIQEPWDLVFPKTLIWSKSIYKITNKNLVFIYSKGSNNCDHILNTILLHHRGLLIKKEYETNEKRGKNGKKENFFIKKQKPG